MPSVHRPSCPPNEMGWPDTYRGELTQLLAHALPCQLSPCVCLPATAPIAKPAKDRRVVSWQPTSILHAAARCGVRVHGSCKPRRPAQPKLDQRPCNFCLLQEKQRSSIDRADHRVVVGSNYAQNICAASNGLRSIDERRSAALTQFMPLVFALLFRVNETLVATIQALENRFNPQLWRHA